MKADGHRISTKKRPGLRNLIFPGCVLVIFGILFAFSPDRASTALKSSADILLNLMVPLSLVFSLMVLMNLFFRPAHIVKFLGKGSGIRGVAFSAAAGVISMGPIYAWYPLLSELRKKGAANSFIAIFLGNRAVKPFLLPIMISYFGWMYAGILTLFTITGALAAGYLVGVLVKE
jgi:uncharacterized membrane protein YraQ (UPF0718 family)